MLFVALITVRGRPVAGATQSLAAIHVNYPLNESVFPPDMMAPMFEWRDDADGAAAWRIEIAFADGSPVLRVASKGERPVVGEIDPRTVSSNNKLPELTPERAAAHTWRPDAATWDVVRRHAVEKPATITITGYAVGSSLQPLSRGQMKMSISRDPVDAPIFYRDVPLMPSATEKGVIKPLEQSAVPLIAWRMRDVAEPASHVVMTGLHSCANCHSFSSDGKTLGLDMDGPQNDKGLYALVPVSEHMTVRTQDMISWASFSGETDPQMRLGFMSQVSPDGRYVMTTIKPPGTKGPNFYYVANFTDYRFLQVFYPTRGILAWYDRAAKKLHPLPGADDPNFVQASAVWSPDGKYLVFARAAAQDPNPPGVKMATYANDPAEMRVQYDLYRIPFNDGRGGTPEPIAGASRNGMSNSFAKVSPDGKWIVFVQAHNGQLMRPDGKLYIVPAGGGTARLMRCNTPLMNSWHSFSPNGRWLVFSSKSRSPYTQMFLTHIDENGNDTPAILIENSTAANRAVNIPEFVRMPRAGIAHIDTPAVDYYKQFDAAADLTNKGQYAAAIPEWEKALAMEPEDARGRYFMGETLLRAGREEDGIAQLRESIRINPHFAEAHNSLGAALGRTGRGEEAEQQLRLALEDKPDLAEAHNNLGCQLLGDHRIREAEVELQAALEAKPEFAEAHLNLGNAYAAEERAEEAIAEFVRAVELDPTSAIAESSLGQTLMAEHKVDEALPHLRKAAELAPTRAEFNTNLGLGLAKSGRPGEAVAYFEQALALAPDSAQAHYYLGKALVLTGRGADGLTQWRQGLHLAPDDLQLLNDTAWVLATASDAALRNGQEALPLAEHAAQLSSEGDPAILGTLAAVYAENGRFGEAVDLERRAAELATQQDNATLAQSLRERLALYQEKTPIRQ